MFILKKIGCRAFQIVFRASLPILPYRESNILFSCDALGTVFSEKEDNPLYPVPKLMTRKELESFYYKIGEFQ